MGLNGQQQKKVADALLDAFHSIADLRIMVRYELNESLDEISGERNLRIVVFELVNWSDRKGRTVELIEAAARYSPRNLTLKRLQEDVSLWLEPQPDSLENSVISRDQELHPSDLHGNTRHEPDKEIPEPNTSAHDQQQTDIGKPLEPPPTCSIPQWVYDDQKKIMGNMKAVRVDPTMIIVPVALGAMASIPVSSASKGIHVAHITAESVEQLTLRGWANHHRPRSAQGSQLLPGWPNQDHDWMLRQIAMTEPTRQGANGTGSFDRAIVLAAIWVRHRAKGKTPEDFLVLIGNEP